MYMYPTEGGLATGHRSALMASVGSRRNTQVVVDASSLHWSRDSRFRPLQSVGASTPRPDTPVPSPQPFWTAAGCSFAPRLSAHFVPMRPPATCSKHLVGRSAGDFELSRMAHRCVGIRVPVSHSLRSEGCRSRWETAEESAKPAH
jgi:hypothetical protein